MQGEGVNQITCLRDSKLVVDTIDVGQRSQTSYTPPILVVSDMGLELGISVMQVTNSVMQMEVTNMYKPILLSSNHSCFDCGHTEPEYIPNLHFMSKKKKKKRKLRMVTHRSLDCICGWNQNIKNLNFSRQLLGSTFILKCVPRSWDTVLIRMKHSRLCELDSA